jgi:PhzF family phenazine biosynthesis protein
MNDSNPNLQDAAPACIARNSPVHGQGVFAGRELHAGERIIEYTGERIEWEEAIRRSEASGGPVNHTFFFSLADGRVIDGGCGGNESRLINHSCEPNCESFEEDGQVFIYAMQDIPAGAELSYSYPLIYEGRHTAAIKRAFACRCGAPSCTGTMLAPKKRTRKKSPGTLSAIERIAAFSDGDQGGNPAGVWIGDTHPDDAHMQRIAAEVGYSETVFAVKDQDVWRARYFSPESEVPFCGHATIALGAVLARKFGDGIFPLQLNQARITVEGRQHDGVVSAALQSPPTRSVAADPALVDQALALFGYSRDDLDTRIAPALAHGGADHLVLCLNSRAKLAAMEYELDAGRALMARAGVVTIMLAYAESAQKFHTRNPFASGGVYEDPATGAATAAFAGYLRDIGWPHGGAIDVVQGEDMDMRSRLRAEIPSVPGSSIRVSGTARCV